MTFRFTITNLGVLLGKSPVTLRHWERKGFIEPMPRVGVNRAVGTQGALNIASVAYIHGRISEERMDLISEAVGLLNLIEQENPDGHRTRRSARQRQD